MHRLLLVFLSLVLLSFVAPRSLTPTTPSDEQAVLDIFDTVAALVRRGDEGRHRPYCSGVFVYHYVVTASHCVVNALEDRVESEIQVGTYQDYDEESGTFSVTYTFFPQVVWEQEDVALLVPEDLTARIHHGTASVATENVTYADEVSPFGNPAGYYYYFSRGEVVSPRRILHNPLSPRHRMPYTLINAVVYPGMSGGPVFNSDGEVIGLVSWGWRSGTWNMVGLVHRDSIERILRSRGVLLLPQS